MAEEVGYRLREDHRGGTRSLRVYAPLPLLLSRPKQRNPVDLEHTLSNYLELFQLRLRIASEPHFFRSDCLRILFNVPGARSSLGFPATVTRPPFVGCLNCLWLPRVATSIHPSSLSIRSTSLTFIGSEYQFALPRTKTQAAIFLCGITVPRISGIRGTHDVCSRYAAVRLRAVRLERIVVRFCASTRRPDTNL